MTSTPQLGDIVSINGKPQLGQATVKFVGPVAGMSAIFVGVELSRPEGKNDGSAKGQRYFTCKVRGSLPR